MTNLELDDGEVIINRQGIGGTGRDCYHTDPDCHHVEKMREPDVVDRTTLPADADECERCAGTYEPGHGGVSGHRQALVEADPSQIGGQS